jgi:putative colanic acid biosynthesis acetyltransferase WcaF
MPGEQLVDLRKSVHPWTVSDLLRRALWMAVWRVLGRHGPRAFSPLRIGLLKLFGARIHGEALICSNVNILMPWNLEIFDAVSIAEGVNVYNHGKVTLHQSAVISQNAKLLTSSHDISARDFPLIWRPISIGPYAWIASEAIVLPGVDIAEGCVIGAGAVVREATLAWGIYIGNPAVKIGQREIRGPNVT